MQSKTFFVTDTYSWLAISLLNLSSPARSFWSDLSAFRDGTGCLLPNKSDDLTGLSRALLAVPHGGEMKTNAMRPAPALKICKSKFKSCSTVKSSTMMSVPQPLSLLLSMPRFLMLLTRIVLVSRAVPAHTSTVSKSCSSNRKNCKPSYWQRFDPMLWNWKIEIHLNHQPHWNHCQHIVCHSLVWWCCCL